MKTYLAIVLTFVLLSVASLRADQNLPVLDELFASLNEELDAGEAVAVTRAIWVAWLAHDDARVRDLMGAGMRAMDARRLHDALAKFDAAIDLAPDFAEAWNKRATVYYLLGNFAASADDVVETLRLEPRHFGALSGQGLMHLQDENYEQALDYFERALTENPYMDNIRRYVEMLKKARDSKAI